MKNVRSLCIAFALTAFTAACSGGTTEQTAPQTAAALSKAPVGANTHGVVKMVGEVPHEERP